MPGFWDATLGGLLGGSVATAILGTAFLRINKTIEGRVQSKFDEAMKIFESKRAWKQEALSELFGPLQMQFERTKRAFRRWNRRNIYLEGKVVREGNQIIHGLLLTKGHLIPPHFMNDAVQLIEHYDAWLEAFDRIREEHNTAEDEPDFVFVGPEGYPFSRESEERFKAEFRELQAALYNR